MDRRTLFVICFLLIPALPARAYLDPASGSMILQLILGGLAGAAVVVKIYWRRLLGVFGRRKPENDDDAV